ncbi:restriction endonuclease subunit S [Sphingobacterium sp.]|uniref:restriction endonuclease subunit S n=1 Tax=Sphingobacterium sp. TaxID=341027 RepID=UPI0028A1F867|nr:restriction endonuclease subunit S [Sphingobacterium sp.]
MSKIEELIAQYCPDGVKFGTIGTVASCYAGATPKTGVLEFWEGGTIPWMSSGEVNKGFVYDTEKKITQLGYEKSSTKIVPSNTVVIALAGQGKTRGMVALTKISLCTNQSLCSIISKETIKSEFLYYFLKTQYKKLRDISSGDGTRGGLNLQMIREFLIPIPPLPVQEEIVNILDKFTALEAELEAELEARKRQYEYYRNELLVFEGKDLEWKTLGDLYDFKNGLNKGKEFFGKGTPIVNFTDVFKNISLTKEKLKGKVELSNIEIQRYNAKANDLFFTRTSEVREEIGMASVLLEDIENCVFSGFVLRARPKTSLHIPKFISYYLTIPSVRNEIIRYSSFTTRGLISGPKLSKIKIPILSLEEQKHIVSILDKFDTLVNDISVGLPAEIAARRQQYEYYRGKLLTFEPLAVAL